MKRQNVTLSLPRSLLKKAKVFAVSNDKSLSELLRESLEERIGEATGYKGAQERQINLLKKGFDFDTRGFLSLSREELHARR